VWAFAKCEFRDDPLFDAISSEALATISEYDPQSMVNIAWAWAFFSLEDAPLLNAIAAAALARISSLNPQDLSNSAWAFSRSAMVDDPLWDSLASEAIRKIRYLGGQGISSTVWAFAHLAKANQPLLAALSSEAIPILHDFGHQSLSLTAWAFATLLVEDEPLFQAIAKESIKNIHEFTTQHLSNTAWAFAKLLVLNLNLLTAIAAQAIATMTVCDPQSIATIAWSFATLGRVNVPLMYSISSEAMVRMQILEPQELSNIAWSFARLKMYDGPLLSAIASESLPKLDHCISLNIANTAWAFAVLSKASLLAAFFPPAVRCFLDFQGVSTGTEMVDLVSVAAKYGPFEGQAELERRFEQHIFIPTMEQLTAIVNVEDQQMATTMSAFRDFLNLRQLPHLGFYYTRHALASLGWHAPAKSASWVLEARHQVWAALGLGVGTPVRTERIVAWISSALVHRDRVMEVSGEIFHAGVAPEVDTEVQNMLRSTVRHMERDNHAERAALLSLVLRLLNTCRAGTTALRDMVGTVRLYVSHFPCTSCVGVLGQFVRLMPKARLEIAFDDAWADD